MSVLFKDKITGLWKRAAANLIYASFPVGSIVAYGGSSDVAAPTGCMYCHGQILNANDYPDLYDVIGTKFGVGDGSTGSFRLPDMRESVPVGAGTNSSNTIAAHDVYTVGQFKDDQTQRVTTGGNMGSNRIIRYRTYPSGGNNGPFVYYDQSGISNGIWSGNGNNDWLPSSFEFDNAKVVRTGKTDHGKRTGVEWIIKVVK